MRFCQAFLLELWKNIGPDTDIPAGDVGVGGRGLAELNQVYSRLLQAMTVNMGYQQPAQPAQPVYQQQPQPAQQQNYQQAYQQPYGYQQQAPYTNNPMK